MAGTSNRILLFSYCFRMLFAINPFPLHRSMFQEHNSSALQKM